MEDLVGRSLGDGRYRLLSVLGRGGMATVYEAEHTRLHRRVAIKVLDPSLTNRPDFVERFQREAETIAQLEHPHILPVYDTGEDGDLLYLVMFLVRDGTLKNRLRSADPPPWEPRRVLQLASQILPALDVAHQQGIVHRDIKPDNILLHGERAFLSDFGIAKLMLGDPGLTVIGTFVGTPEYAAPEQVLALPLDGRSDLYSFAVVLYELLVGHVPYQGDTPMGVALQHVQASLTPPTEANPDLSPTIARVLVNALAKERDRRYPTGAALVAALEEAVRESDLTSSGHGAAPPLLQPGTDHSSYPNEAELEAQRQAAAAEARRVAEEEEARRAAAEQEAQRQAAAQRAAEEAEARRRAAEQEEAERQAAQAAAQRAAEQAEARRAAAEAEARRVAQEDDAARRKADEEEATRQVDRERLRREREPVAAAPTGLPRGEPAAAPVQPAQSDRNRAPLLITAAAAIVVIGGLIAFLTTRSQPVSPTAAVVAATSVPITISATSVAQVAPSAAPTIAPATTVPTPVPQAAPTTAPAGNIAAIAAAQPTPAVPPQPTGASTPQTQPTPLAPTPQPAAAPASQAQPTTTPTPQATPTAVPAPAAPPALATPRYGYTASLLQNGKLLMVGGRGASGPIADASLFDPSTNSWSPAAAPATPSTKHTATTLGDGRILVVGGQKDDSTFLSTTEIYDPAKNTWSAAGDLESARADHTATLLNDGRVLVVGGTNGREFLNSAEIFDPAANSWRSVAPMPNGRSQHTATLLADGRVLVVGGFGAENSATLYDPTSDTWTPAAPMATPRLRHTATLLRNGKVLVIGGSNSGSGTTGADYVKSAELYDPASNAWSPAGEMTDARSGHTATLLPGGQILVIGGNDGQHVLASIEGYDPASNRWVVAAPMSVARWLHTSTLVAGGQIVVAGGSDGTNPVSSVERYDLATNTWYSSKP